MKKLMKLALGMSLALGTSTVVFADDHKKDEKKDHKEEHKEGHKDDKKEHKKTGH